MTGLGVAILGLVLGGIVIGVNLGPRAAKVEQKVIAPVREAATGGSRSDPRPDLIAAACPAVVAIQADRPAPAPARRRKGGKGPATAPQPVPGGFLVSPDGYVLTAAASLPASGAIQVRLNDGREFDAVRAGADPLSGLALLKVDAKDLPVLAFASAGFPRIGESGIALVSPHGSGCTAEAAMVSGDFIARPEGSRAYFEARPALDRGYAGVPMIDSTGQVIGIAGLDPGPPGAGQATTRLLPAATASRIATEMMRGGTAAENGFGFDAEDLVPVLADRIGADRQRGAIVSLVAADSPAEAAGLRAGDVIFAAGGEPVSGASELARALDGDAPQVKLELMRGGERVKLVLTAKPAA
jgi:S1-C subfamily serine protease